MTPLKVAVDFVAALRAASLAVPLASSRLFTQALSEINLANPDEVFWTARAVLVKRPEDFEVFDQVFVAYWGGLGSGLVWRTQPPPTSVTLAIDDSTQPPSPQTDTDNNNQDDENNTENIIVRYCATETLNKKDFADYTETELSECRSVMQSIAVLGALRVSRRRVPTRKMRGNLDMRRTMHRALRTAGEPLVVARTVVGMKPRRLVLLLDVSGSMEPYARVLISFVHVCVASRMRVEAFALGTRLTRLTRELSQRDPDRALKAAAQSVDDWSGGTRLAEGLQRFNDDWGTRGMARGATVVILSDGWDRGEPALMQEQMQRLSRVAHRLVWVNPLKASPGYAPLAQAMAAALPYIDDFVEGHCLDSLRDLAKQVLSGGRAVPFARHGHAVGVGFQR